MGDGGFDAKQGQNPAAGLLERQPYYPDTLVLGLTAELGLCSSPAGGSSRVSSESPCRMMKPAYESSQVT